MASLAAITPCTIVRLMRTVSTSSGRRCFRARGTSFPEAASRSTMTPRSAWGKIVSRLSSTFGNTSLSATARPRFRLISIMALSLAWGLTSSRRLDEPEETSSRVMTVELLAGGLVVDHQGRGLERGDGAAAAGGLLVGRVVMENHDDVAERDAVLIVEQMSLADLAAVDVGAVAALHVLDVELVVDPLDPRMLAADRPGVEHDIAVGMPAQDGRLAIQREHSARVRAFNRA